MRIIALTFALAISCIGAEVLTTHTLPEESTNRVLLVKPRASVKSNDVEKLRGTLKLEDATKSKRLKWRQFVVPPGRSKKDAIELLKHSGLFDHVIEPQIYKTQETIPNDPSFPQLWGMTNIEANLAWDRIRDALDVVVAVVDTGIDFSHPDLAANLWTGPNGEHGYVATNGVVLEGGLDDHGHGTHVAGTIGAVGNNGVGVVGLAWKVQIMAMKVLHKGSGTSLDIVNGYEKLVELKEAGVPVLVSNHSYGGGSYDQYMEDGFRLLAEADIFAAVAAGNNGQNIDVNPFSPASFAFDNMVVALASDSAGRKAGFSNFGLVGSDITAPGVAIWSTTRSNTYSSFSGTSMASPHVAGLATLVRQSNRSLTASQTREVILHPDSYDLGDYFSSTSGKINAAKTVNNPKLFEQPFITNSPPQIESVTPYTLINDQKPVTILATGSDPEGDPLKWSTLLSGLNSFFERQLLGLSGFFLTNIDNLTVVSGGPYAYQLASQLTIGLSDRRGGSASTNTGFEFVLDRAHRKPIQVKTWTATTNVSSSNLISITFDVEDAAKTNYLYGLMISFPRGNIQGYWGKQPGPNPQLYSRPLSSSVFSVRVFVMDKWFNYLTTDPIIYHTNSLDLLPQCIVTATTNEGNAPFPVTFDLSQSKQASGYAVFDLFVGSFAPPGPIQTIQFDAPGIYFKMPLAFGTIPGEIDFTVIPVFASRFLGTNAAPKTDTISMLLQTASQAGGPWSDVTNSTVTVETTTPNRFYRSKVSLPAKPILQKSLPPLPFTNRKP